MFEASDNIIGLLGTICAGRWGDNVPAASPTSELWRGFTAWGLRKGLWRRGRSQL